ncbi:MAG: hypothetical protein D6691_08195 [Candidatus Hydrogenedentota bacterium]|jgi:hypothetical protein|uniref:Uncharacterized protein n=1 Tax=Sumerlaea chitinivorans TaxID=2250252 RepID=A0A2Z4Y5H5_SUMC1|nr:hypothetical protein BRCON_1452 [Candidatus Sumerlaea chitinivorans]MCX7964457.1 hypothetical protein [Candidatus Sumerlaea chitinivorans]RMH26259.1 MAG: hypothetical protein D6691_08195 [Candidatus Hydrogenedentota bacterium]GIX44977.1 MAG: hypothetical protein KatS3mg130_1385 [Candidatus Sumerlaea sp.]
MKLRKIRQRLTYLTVVAVLGGCVWFFSTNTGPVAMWFRSLFFRARAHAVNPVPIKPLGNVQAAQACRENLQRIQTAKRRVAEKRATTTGVATWEEVLREMYPQYASRRFDPTFVQQLMPRCPAGGVYELGRLEELAKCSVGANGTVDSADDHVIYR